MKFDTNESIPLDAYRISPVTIGNDHGNQFMVLSAPHRVDYNCFVFLPCHLCAYFKGGINRMFVTI